MAKLYTNAGWFLPEEKHGPNQDYTKHERHVLYRIHFREDIETPWGPLVAFGEVYKQNFSVGDETVVPGFYVGQNEIVKEDAVVFDVYPVPHDKRMRKRLSKILLKNHYREPINFLDE